MTSNAATEPVRPRVGPFAGVLIADLTHALSGPFCIMLLAELGARVVKVERPPAGDVSRAFGPFIDGDGMMFTFANRGKESIALDIEAHPDRELLRALVQRADVVVENFRPGTLERHPPERPRPPALDADGAAIRRELAQPAQGPGRG